MCLGPPARCSCRRMQAWQRPGQRAGRPRPCLTLVLTLAGWAVLLTFSFCANSFRITCLASLRWAARSRSAHTRYRAFSLANAARCLIRTCSMAAMARVQAFAETVMLNHWLKVTLVPRWLRKQHDGFEGGLHEPPTQTHRGLGYMQYTTNINHMMCFDTHGSKGPGAQI